MKASSLVVLAALLTLAPSSHAAQAREIVLFSFDDYSIPFNKGLLLTLVPGEKSQPVITPGKPGSPDDRRVYFSGTVIKIGDEYRMWYSGFDQDRVRHICYAVSKDGLKWTRPSLGLVEYHGNKDNNLVAIDDGKDIRCALTLVVHDRDDPNPDRRFKMLREMDPNNSVKAAFSADGLRWKSAAGDKFVIATEPSGLVKHDGLFYLNGHAGAIRHPVPGAHKRTMQTFVSSDFEHWTTAAHMSFRRDNIPPRPPTDLEFNRGPQVHTGASIWDRGNVFLAFYGQYDNPTNDRRTSTCDLGLLLSHDALHFKEPVPDFKIVPSFEELDRAEPRLTQGQAYENIGDKTMFWYGVWTEVDRDGPTGVRVATWPRDRLGYFRPARDITDCHCISRSIEPTKSSARIYLNANGLDEKSQLTVELLDAKLRPIPGYTGNDCVPVDKSGLRVPVAWRGKTNLAGLDEPYRIRVNWVGDDADGRLWAIYVDE
jgi:hypothetical protein